MAIQNPQLNFSAKSHTCGLWRWALKFLNTEIVSSAQIESGAGH